MVGQRNTDFPQRAAIGRSIIGIRMVRPGLFGPGWGKEFCWFYGYRPTGDGRNPANQWM